MSAGSPVPAPTLGTLLRHLIERLDGDLQAVYGAEGLDYRPRFTPVIRLLGERGPASIQEIVRTTALSHSALSQTVSEMTRRGLIEVERGDDGRERIVRLTEQGAAMLPQLRRCWAATNAAAEELSNEAGGLEGSVVAALAALDERSFFDRIAAKRRHPRQAPVG